MTTPHDQQKPSGQPIGSRPRRRRGRTAGLSVAAAFFVALLAPAIQLPTAGAAPFKVVVNGQDITGRGYSTPSCQDQDNGYQINIGAASVVLSHDRTQVQDLNLLHPPNQWGWGPGRPGNVQVTQSGNTYTFTGNVPPIDSNGVPNGSPVPFEVDVTCP